VSNVVPVILVLAAGMSVALQQVLNARLRSEIGSPWWAGVVSYVSGTLAMATAALVARELPSFRPPTTSADTLAWTGGLFGAFFIAMGILMVPRLGAATVLALIVVGQMVASLTFDHFGLFGVARHPADPVRLAGTVCLIAGVILVRR
jgi:bacterial/archaeal transporter family-2 protein